MVRAASGASSDEDTSTPLKATLEVWRGARQVRRISLAKADISAVWGDAEVGGLHWSADERRVVFVGETLRKPKACTFFDDDDDEGKDADNEKEEDEKSREKKAEKEAGRGHVHDFEESWGEGRLTQHTGKLSGSQNRILLWLT